MIQFSFSSMETFKNCQRRYKHQYILKDVRDEGNEATFYGTEVHTAIENYALHGTPIPPAYAAVAAPAVSLIDNLRAKEWDVMPEFEMALDYTLTPCDFMSDQRLVRGIADLVSVKGEKGKVADWKTGKTAKFAKPAQLELMALMMFKHFPQLQTIDGALVFLVAGNVITQTYQRSECKQRWRKWIEDVQRMEFAVQNQVFNASPNSLCGRFCPVPYSKCEHSGRGA